jgi:hypothetical protein
MKNITSRIETAHIDPSGYNYNDLYTCIVTVDGTEFRSPRRFGMVRDARVAALAVALKAGAITDAEAWEELTGGQTDGRGVAFLSKFAWAS